MIRLSEQSPLGTGRHRKCYAHPEDAQRCIKIVYHRGDGGDKEIRRELKYYAHLGRRLKDWSGIPRYHGTAKWHLNRSQFGIRIDHDLASISDHSLASQSITIWHTSDH